MTTKLQVLEEKRAPVIERYGDGRPVLAEKPTREECLERRREAAKAIVAIRKEWTPRVEAAAERLADCERGLRAARLVLGETEEKHLAALQCHGAALRQRDGLVAEQEKITAAHLDAELKRTIGELEGELHEVRQNYGGKSTKRIERLKSAIVKANELHSDPGIMNTVKLDAALVALALTRNE